MRSDGGGARVVVVRGQAGGAREELPCPRAARHHGEGVRPNREGRGGLMRSGGSSARVVEVCGQAGDAREELVHARAARRHGKARGRTRRAEAV